ncbi:LacI family DNA-binding transcriptional regulator [Dictyobacter arantiisoli]|uniref:LacI family transcriptional regulator n=1 Tax=Dictyobacter arantiisoli TaxID=2014874 RepID=A0A5A5TBR3_9CHLR|nr:LacI family DNA-binding transcriptional regulator [Dictyobacter arantiisoli]GCF08449.1 LacI family transcriptional regulator [Dictyobacter arantiisoli]
MAGKITIQDIAQMAGVSKTTVSRVLNHRPDVNPETRERILHIMDEQGFFPSLAAAGLAGGRSRLIGALVSVSHWPLIPEIMRGIAEVVDQTPYELVLYSSNAGNDAKNYGEVIDRIQATKLTAGLLAIYPGQATPHLADLCRQGFPVVMFDDQGVPPDDVSWVGADQRTGAYQATRHLLQQGHRRIAHIQGPLKYQVSLDRYQGYCDALAEEQVEIEPEFVLQGDFTTPGGKECASQFFAQIGCRPTAIFASNDLMAYGALSAVVESGLRVPEDVAVVGFDDISFSVHSQPPLTTVRQPLYEMGKRSIEVLLSMIDPPEPQTRPWNHKSAPRIQGVNALPVAPVHVRLATNLVMRASSGCAPSPTHTYGSVGVDQAQ